MGKYTIKDMESLSGIKAHTLRIWEQRYKFLKPKRTATNIRYYTDEDLRLILNISLLNKNGFRISKISKMGVEEILEKVKQISETSDDNDRRIESLVIAMVDLDEAQFDKVINTVFIQLGFERTFREVLFPFMERIGVLWSTGSINPLHEHFVSNLIRQKLMVAIDGQIVKPGNESRRVVLFLPEHEMHELGLLFANFLLRSRNHDVLYLGMKVPLADVKLAIDSFAPEVVFSVVTVADTQDAFYNEFLKIVKRYDDVEFCLTGNNALQQDMKLPSNCRMMRGVDDTVNFFDQL